jgi:hypothetical protein
MNLALQLKRKAKCGLRAKKTEPEYTQVCAVINQTQYRGELKVVRC